MKIKDYKCTCQHTDFTFWEKDKSHLGIYCLKCGKWYKWADKSERRLWEMNKEDKNVIQRNNL